MPKIRVLLIEDNRLLREGIAAMLNQEQDIRAISTSGNGDAFDKAKELKPHVVLLDRGLRSRSSLKVMELIKKDNLHTEFIVMDLVPIQDDIIEFVKAGVAGFILKDATLDDFLHTIRSVAQGTKILPPTMAGSLFSHIVEHAIQNGQVDSLIEAVRMTKREREILDLIAAGRSNKEIAGELNIAVHTVKSHVHNILEKLALHTRLELANFAHTKNIYKNASGQA
jgi:DNA-binding NarL/FixJ family response regulator